MVSTCRDRALGQYHQHVKNRLHTEESGAEPFAVTRMNLLSDIRNPCHASTTLRYYSKFRNVNCRKGDSLTEIQLIKKKLLHQYKKEKL